VVRISRLVGLPVVSLEGARKVGITKEVWLSRDLLWIRGFSVGLRRLISSVRFLPFSRVFSLTTTSVTVHSEDVTEQLLEYSDCGLRFHKVASSIARTRDGTVVGSLSDLFADENTGRVQELEVSEGVLQDITKGRSRIHRSACIEFNGQAIILVEGVVGS
jgi:uncharacterized protein YrrD